MTNEEATSVIYELFLNAMKIGGPVLIISMVVGIAISVIQAATQIHEQTLTFVPKLVTIGVLLIIMGGTMLDQIQEFTTRIFELMAGY